MQLRTVRKGPVLPSCGIGAVCKVQLKYLHPAKLISEKYPEFAHQQKLEKLLALRQETIVVNRREQVCVVFRSEEFEDKELYCVKRWVKVTTEDPRSSSSRILEDPRRTLT